MTFEEAVIAVVRALSPGEIATYGEVAEEAGHPGAARAVGNVMASSEGLPWWRIVRSDGSLAVDKGGEQARRLQAEGVEVRGGRVRPQRSPSV